MRRRDCQLLILISLTLFCFATQETSPHPRAEKTPAQTTQEAIALPRDIVRLSITHTGVRDIDIKIPTESYLHWITERCKAERDGHQRRWCIHRLKQASIAASNANWVINPLYGRPALTLFDLDFALRESQSALWILEASEQDLSIHKTS